MTEFRINLFPQMYGLQIFVTGGTRINCLLVCHCGAATGYKSFVGGNSLIL